MRKNIAIGIIALLLSGCAMTSPYRQEFTLASNPMPEVVINIVPVGSAWNFEITNNTENTIKFLVDESSYVTTDGRAERLIRGKTRVIHSDSVQPPMPIPPKAMFKDFIILESTVQMGDMLFYYSAVPTNPSSSAKFYLVFEIDGKKKTVTYNVKFIKPN